MAWKHGASAYRSYGCRCWVCRADNSARAREERRRRWGRTPPKHGASGYSNYGCRCEVCTQENLDKGRTYYQEVTKKGLRGQRRKPPPLESAKAYTCRRCQNPLSPCDVCGAPSQCGEPVCALHEPPLAGRTAKV